MKLAALKGAGAELIVLEARSTIGGVWRSFGNPHSRVNSTEPAYRMRVQREQPKPPMRRSLRISDASGSSPGTFDSRILSSADTADKNEHVIRQTKLHILHILYTLHTLHILHTLHTLHIL